MVSNKLLGGRRARHAGWASFPTEGDTALHVLHLLVQCIKVIQVANQLSKDNKLSIRLTIWCNMFGVIWCNWCVQCVNKCCMLSNKAAGPYKFVCWRST